MSGGSYGYIYSRLQDECLGRMYDIEMNDLIKDLVLVLRNLEWWQSCDSGEDDYRKVVAEFKYKWFKSNRTERLKGYIDKELADMRELLYNLIGVKEERDDEESLL